MALELWRPERSLIRRDLFSDFEREISGLFNRVLHPWFPRAGEPGTLGWNPAMDLIEREGELILSVDLPGVKEKDIQLNVEENVLTLKGQREQRKDEKGTDFYAQERWAGTFSRSLALPRTVNPDKISASFKNGVLEVRMPRTKEARGRQIEVQTS